MMTPPSSNTLVLKARKWKHLLGCALFFCLFWFVYQDTSKELLHPDGMTYKAYHNAQCLHFFGPALMVLAVFAFIAFLLPGGGDLILSPEGFTLKSIFRRFDKTYKWSEVCGFYIDIYRVRLKDFKRIYFQFADKTKPQKYSFLVYSYGMPPEELLSLLTQWKTRYSPEPSNLIRPSPEAIEQREILSKQETKWGWIIILSVVLLISIVGVLPRRTPVKIKNQDDYIQYMQRKIKQRWHPVVLTHSATPIVKFSIQQDGTLYDAHIKQSSGNAKFDRSCIRAVENASPLPPLSPDLKGHSVDIELIFDYGTNSIKNP